MTWSQGDRLEQVANFVRVKLETRIAEQEAEARKNASNRPELLKERAEKEQEAWGLTDFIVAHGSQASRTVRARLAAAEGRVRETMSGWRSQMNRNRSHSRRDKIEEHLRNKLSDFRSLLPSTPLTGKQIIRRHIQKITLTRRQLRPEFRSE